MDTMTWVLLYIVLPILLGILGNLVTPWAKSYIDKGSLSIRDRRLYLLQSKYDRVKKYHLSPEMFALWMIRRLASGMFYLMVVTFGIGIHLLSPQLPWFFSWTLWYFGTAIGVSRMDGLFTLYREVIYFEDFKKEVVEKMKKLGGDPEDLDKEETTGG